MSDLVTVILAAGKGTRMKSKLPKVLHKAGGKSMVQHVIDAAKAAGSSRTVVITGFGSEAVRAAIGEQAECVEQKEQLGTGTCYKGVTGQLGEGCGWVAEKWSNAGASHIADMANGTKGLEVMESGHDHASVVAVGQFLPRFDLGLYTGAKAVVDRFFHINLVILDLITIGKRAFIHRMNKLHAEPFAVLYGIAGISQYLCPIQLALTILSLR